MITIEDFKKKQTSKTRLIGLDLGSKRIGVSICDEKQSIATPYKTIDRVNTANFIDELKEINVCTGYSIDNKNYDYLPSEEFLFDKIKPVYKKVVGWEKSTAGINKFEDLPENAKKYIKILEDLMETNISIVSTGPDRKETIDINGTLSNI